MARYGMTTSIKDSYDNVKTRLVDALKEQGFGILSTIDIQSTLTAKLGEDIERYEILGACNPQLAYQTLSADRHIGLLLPCNVVLRELGDETEVSILNPEVMFSVADEDIKTSMGSLPQEAKVRLENALESLKSSD